MLGKIFERFVKESPISVMVRELMERVFAPLIINRVLEENVSCKYRAEVLFPNLVKLMNLVVSRIHLSVSVAYLAEAEEVNVSTAVYDKLGGRGNER